MTRATYILRCAIILIPLTLSGCGDGCSLCDLILTAARAVKSALPSNVTFHAGAVPRDLGTADIAVTQLPVDLVIAVGDSLNITGTELNQGKGAADAHQVGLLRTGTAVGAVDSVLATIAINRLVPKDSAKAAKTIKAISSGVAIIEMVANYAKKVLECDSTNNTKQVDLTGVASTTSLGSRRQYLVVRVVPETELAAAKADRALRVVRPREATASFVALP